MQKVKFEYTEKHHILEVDGVEYEIPQRTEKLAAKIREHDTKLPEMSEYEANISLLEILFGKANAKKMFPDKENTNLDKLARCTKFATALFLADYTATRDEKVKDMLAEINPFLDKLSGVNDLVQKVQSKAELKKVTRGKK